MKKKAFTLIEAIITIAIMALLVGLSSLSIVNFGKGSTLESGQSLVLSALRQAQSNSSAEVSDKAWGVHFDSSRVIIYQDNGVFNPSDSTNQVKIMPTGVSISGPSEITFEKGKVTTLTSGTVTLVSTSGNTSSVITINSEGRIDY